MVITSTVAKPTFAETASSAAAEAEARDLEPRSRER